MSNVNPKEISIQEIERHIEELYPTGRDAHGAEAPTVEQVLSSMWDYHMGADLLQETIESHNLDADTTRLLDEVLGQFIHRRATGDASFAALEFRNCVVPELSGWLEVQLPFAA